MSEYVMSVEEKISYLMPSKKENDFLARRMTDLNLDCMEDIFVDHGARGLLNEDPAEYRCKNCGSDCRSGSECKNHIPVKN